MSELTNPNGENVKKRTYPREAAEAAFLLGGIGAGNVSVGSRGELRDWEIFNLPAKGQAMPNTFFAIRVKPQGGEPVARVLESRLNPPHPLSHGYHPITAAGLPRLQSSILTGEMPFAKVDFEDDALPVSVSLEAYSPFIPLNPDDSGIPGAVLTYSVKNLAGVPVEAAVVGSLFNAVGGLGYDKFGNIKTEGCGLNRNEFKQENGLSGLYMTSGKYAEKDLQYGNLTLAMTNARTTYKRAWFRGAWFDFLQEFWDDFAEDGRLTDLGYETPTPDGATDTGSIGAIETLEPGETKTFRFILSWYFPNRLNGWDDSVRVTEPGRENVRVYYSTQFASSWHAASYLAADHDRLYGESERFRRAFEGTTLPGYVLEALSASIPVLRSTTCFRLADGRFLGYEGCFDDLGCCPGSCTHVWNYAQTLAFLFPSLERDMRRTEYGSEVDPDGKMNFRAFQMFDSVWSWNGTSAAADGQLGTVMRVYREWKLSGDDAFLREVWPAVKRTIRHALLEWDTDGDFVLDGKQHNTYDIDFYGPNPLTGIMLLGALKAAEQIAGYLGESELAAKYGDAFARSSAGLEEATWNGEYYVQRIEDVNAHKYQHGLGCLSDQLLGQQLAHLYGLGYLLQPERVQSAVKAVFDHNFRSDFTGHVNCQRTYVLNDEQGLLLCSWPYGGRPKLPFVYSDEVWTGIEYHVATHLIYEGFVEEGLTLVRAVRDRHDGFKRSPWNDVECGHHYARSMSAWGLLLALSGFRFDMVKKEMSFEPVLNAERFETFWSTGLAWGVYRQRTDPATGEREAEVEVLYGSADGIKVSACGKNWML